MAWRMLFLEAGTKRIFEGGLFLEDKVEGFGVTVCFDDTKRPALHRDFPNGHQ